LLIAFSGCAKQPQEVLLVYPSPPDEPRIAYLRSYSGVNDFGQNSLFDRLLGSPERTFSKPYGVSATGSKIFITLTGIGGGVAVLDTKQQTMTHLRSKDLTLPTGVASMPDGGVYVADATTKRIFKFDPSGQKIASFSSPDGIKNPGGLALSVDGTRLYVADAYDHSVKVFSPAGALLFQFGGNGQADGKFLYPSNIAVDRRNGNVIVADTQNFRVQVFDRDGKFIRKFGEIGDVPGSFSRPKGVGVDSEGHIYITDAAFSNIQIFDENGQLLLYFGERGNIPGSFDLPAGMYIDAEDRIYVVDSLNSRVQVFQYLSEKWKQGHPAEYQKYLLIGQPAPGSAASGAALQEQKKP